MEASAGASLFDPAYAGLISMAGLENLISYLLDCSSYLISLHSKVEKLQWESRNLEQHVFACFDLWMLEPFDAPTHLPSIHRCFTF